MDKTEDLRAGITEMRSVARRLSQWADDLEASFRGQETDAAEVPASEPGPAEKKKRAKNPAGNESAAAPEKGKALTLPEIRAILAGKCSVQKPAAGQA